MGNGNFSYINSLHNFLWEFDAEREVVKSGMLRRQIEGCSSPALPRNSSRSASCKEQSYFKLNISTSKVSHWKRLFAFTCTEKRNGKEMNHLTCWFPTLWHSVLLRDNIFLKNISIIGIYFLLSQLAFRCWQLPQEVFLCRATNTALECSKLFFAFRLLRDHLCKSLWTLSHHSAIALCLTDLVKSLSEKKRKKRQEKKVLSW